MGRSEPGVLEKRREAGMDNKSLQARLAALRETAVELNAASDALTQRIRNTESQLEALKLGVAVIRSEAFRRDWETEIINSGPPPRGIRGPPDGVSPRLQEVARQLADSCSAGNTSRGVSRRVSRSDG